MRSDRIFVRNVDKPPKAISEGVDDVTAGIAVALRAEP
jgi:hypothetical protein